MKDIMDDTSYSDSALMSVTTISPHFIRSHRLLCICGVPYLWHIFAVVVSLLGNLNSFSRVNMVTGLSSSLDSAVHKPCDYLIYSSVLPNEDVRRYQLLYNLPEWFNRWLNLHQL